MKKLYFLLFASNLFFAQSSDLINTDWQVTKVIGELSPDQVPPAMPYQQVTRFNSNMPQLNLSFFNTVSANLSYTGENMFTVNNKACTLADYMGDNGEVNQFFGRLCSFFLDNGNYYYTIQNNGTEKTLVISNAIFQEIHFKSANLSVKDNDLKKHTVYPNPATDYIIVNNLKVGSNLELIDSSGKLLKTISTKSTKEEINVRGLSSGVYYLKSDGEFIQKFIKK
ncbi:MAG: hypothetical protein DI529_01930 [Chryseobacterium sp.]|nr:MAG: hypothetical protein DI529_01930 [Chryseobacterium sp.]